MRVALLVLGLLGSVASAAEPVATSGANAAAPSRELGLPFFDVFDPRDYRGHMQVWCAVQDAAGLTYFGNYGRVLVYDGARWDKVDVPGTSFIRALAVDQQDVLWIAAVNELGYAATDTTGRRVFTSLRDKLPPDARECGELWRVLLTPRGPIFQSNTWLLRWDGDKFTTLALEGPNAWQLVAAGDTLWVTHNQKGWFTLTNGAALTLTPYDRPAAYDNAAINFVLPGDVPGEFIFGTTRAGLVKWDGHRFTPYPTAIDDILKQKRLYRGTRLADGRIALTTLQAGAYLLDARGLLLATLDEDARMPDNGAISPFAARDGSLWICLQRGAVRVDARPWLTWFGPARGAPRAAIQPVTRFRGEFFTCSDNGLIRLIPATDTAPARLAQVPQFTEFLNGTAVAGDVLIGFGDTGIWEWRGGDATPSPLPGRPTNAFGFGEAVGQPGRWFAQLSSGLTSYRRENGEWIFEGPIPSLVNIRSVAVDDKGTWWLGTPSEGVMRVTFPHANHDGPGEPDITRFTAGHGLPAGHGWARVSLDDTGPLLRCERGFFRFNEAAQRFEPTQEFGERFANGSTTARSLTGRDRRDGTWIAARPAGEAELVTNVELGVAGKGGWRPVHLPQLARLDDVASLDYEETGDVMWVAVHGGIIRMDLARWRSESAIPDPVVVLRSAETDGSARLPLNGGWQLPYARRALHLTFAAPALAGDTTGIYESTLLGGGDPIVLTDATAQREFSALASGDYTLRLRARNGSGQWSAPLEFSFTVLPPWWRSGWAWVGYGMLGIFAMGGFVSSRTRALQRRAEQLEATVAVRTEELRKSNAELVRLHRLELDEKIAARLAEEKARLEVLRYQLNPHFLFNALTSVCAELPPGFGGARAIIERLTDFCQMTLFRPANDESPTLGQEMKMLTAYLDIEKTRWGDLLQVDVTVAPAATEKKIPSLLLLPLVENALKYGQATTRDQLKIRLAAQVEPDGAGGHGTLAIEIANTGHWVAPTERGVVPSLGIGHENLRQRLKRYYPGAHEFTTESKDGWVTVRLRLRAPLRE